MKYQSITGKWVFRLALAGAVALAGCGPEKPVMPVSRYPQLPRKKVPVYLKDTILERTDLAGTDSFVVSGFGLVVNLRDTGDTTAPTAVRDFIVKEMTKRGMGMRASGLENMSPEQMLNDRRVAIVRVDAAIPPGARKGQFCDARVSALSESNTTSLAHGDLYETELRVNGANSTLPGGGNVTVHAVCRGPVFINPGYAAASTDSSAGARASRRFGLVMDGALITETRPLVLRLREPQRSTARAIEARVRQYFQDKEVAAAKDEGIVEIFVPAKFNGDWEHFVGIVRHLYLNSSTDFAAVKARQLAEAAVQKDAPLEDISYCWEALGPASVPFIQPLMTGHPPDVTYAAARAAVFLGDSSAVTVLAGIARTEGSPFQLNALQTLGAIPPSPIINQILRSLLDSDTTRVRIEAFQILARNKDPMIYTKVIREKFVLDIVPSKGSPVIYATRRGVPRIAIIGDRAALNLPVMFTALNNSLSISSAPDSRDLTIFYRGEELKKPAKVLSSPDLAEVVARLGGEGAPGQAVSLNFTYGDIVAMLQSMVDGRKLSGMGRNGKREPVAFVLQEAPRIDDAINTAPVIPEGARPQGDPVKPEGEMREESVH